MPEARLNFEVVVVGAGPAGLAAACVAAEKGRRVALVDETPWLGGQIWRGNHPHAAPWVARLGRTDAQLLRQHTILGPLEPRVLLAETPTGRREIAWERLILATGARELFLPFPGWTLPGNFGVGGLQSLAKHGWPVAGKRIVIAGSGPLLLAVAAGLRKMGAMIVSVNEQASWARVAAFGAKLSARWPDKLFQAASLKRALGRTPHRCGVWPVAAEGEEDVRSVALTDGSRRWSEDCDYLACGFGLVPNLELPLALGCQMDNGFVRAGQWQDTSAEGVFCAGELAGVGGADVALVEGQIAGLAASMARAEAYDLLQDRAGWQPFRAALAKTFSLRPELRSLALPGTLVCRCEDVPYEKMRSFSGWRDAKLQTRCGMGSCQGRVCGAAAKVLFGWGMESVRPPVLPGRVGSLAPAAVSGND